MKKTFATLLAGSVMLVGSVAHAEDPTVVAERRALKPGPGLYVVDTTIDVKVGRAFVKNSKGFSVPGGWQPTSLKIDLWGKSDSANAIIVKWKDGAKVALTTECPSPDIADKQETYGAKNWDDQAEVNCEVKDGLVAFPKTGTFDAEIYLRAAGKPDQLLRKITFMVGSVRDTDSPNATINYYVDHDYKLAETVGYWNWDGGSLNLRAYTKQAVEPSGTGKLRCTQNGVAMADGRMMPGGGMSLQVRDGAHDKEINVVQLDGAMDIPRASGTWKPGRYECQMIHSAKVLRTIRFQLDAKLALVTSVEQQPRAGAIASRTTYLPDFDIPLGIDLPFTKAAFGALALSGRPWLGPVPSAASSGATMAVVTEPAAAAPSAATAATATTPVTPKKAKGKGKGKKR